MNLGSIVDGHDDDSIALISRGRSTSYGDLRDQIDRLRGGFASVGIGDGDRVALLCSNSRHFIISYLAVVGLGGVVVPLNPLSPSPEIEAELDDDEVSSEGSAASSAASLAARAAFERIMNPVVKVYCRSAAATTATCRH